MVGVDLCHVLIHPGDSNLVFAGPLVSFSGSHYTSRWRQLMLSLSNLDIHFKSFLKSILIDALLKIKKPEKKCLLHIELPNSTCIEL